MNKITDTTSIKQTLTFTVPNVLIGYEVGAFPTLKLRQGGPVQVEVTVTTDLYDAPLDESANVFRVKAQNQINVGALRVLVLNDEITGDKPIAPSSPTASDYMENVGKTVLTSFNCVKVISDLVAKGKDVFKVTRSTITLP